MKSIINLYLENNNITNYYFLSKQNMDNKTLTPRIPNNYFTKNGYEDNKTPRVCLSKTIDGALMGLSMSLKNQKLYVHIPLNNVKIVQPTIKQVPDCQITKEVWATDNVLLKCIGVILVTNDKGLDGHVFKYGDNEAELYDWDWKWVERMR